MPALELHKALCLRGTGRDAVSGSSRNCAAASDSTRDLLALGVSSAPSGAAQAGTGSSAVRAPGHERQVVGLPHRLGHRGADLRVGDRPADAVLARRAHDGLGDARGHAAQLADAREQAARCQVLLAHLVGQALGGGARTSRR